MARKPRPAPSAERVKRAVGRTVANVTAVGLSLAVLGAWSYFGWYTLEPGQAAVILQFGRYQRTELEPGLRWHLPPPAQSHVVVNVASINKEEFGVRTPDVSEAADESAQAPAGRGVSMQTSDANIVQVGFVVQYRIKDAFQSRYRIAAPREVLRDTAEASVRSTVGRNTIDAVLREKKGIVEREALDELQARLDRYEAGLDVLGVDLQDVQPPEPVRAAFDDVLGASQDRDRAVNEAEGYANEVRPRARAEAIEQIESARGYRDSTIAVATGEAERFRALAAEYARAPEVIRTRLFLETMEQILPQVQTYIVEPGSSVLPHLPLGRPSRAAEPESMP
ncbi:FtsH protease activity modulator HflK [Myxococcota bacterium]|nr:FtsH protease activity modulator HflK [Myxococcota bacterium]MCZ7618857.1 FtsH protease activity modulator HflK [Myxococcota bacterium]